jgi:hypothetical protein
MEEGERKEVGGGGGEDGIEENLELDYVMGR